MLEMRVSAAYQPTGDQPRAIAELTECVNRGDRFTTRWARPAPARRIPSRGWSSSVQKPTLVIAHNKTLAAQLCNEFREYFPHNAVEYFVSYYDYYQPEAYLPTSDTYIEKDSSINDDIDRLRHAATAALFARRDVLIVASRSCIYGMGSPIATRRWCCFWRSATSGRASGCSRSWSRSSTRETTSCWGAASSAPAET
jgi:excinuclease ABC subunit B